MKQFLRIAICGLTLLTATSVHAQLGFISGLIIGNAMSGDKIYGGNGHMMALYEMPRAQERVKNPLEMRVVSTANTSFSHGSHLRAHSLLELFQTTLGKDTPASRFEIIYVALAPDPSSKSYAAVWFFYITKDHVIPINELPPPKK